MAMRCVTVAGPHAPHTVERPDGTSWRCDGWPENRAAESHTGADGAAREIAERMTDGPIETK